MNKDVLDTVKSKQSAYREFQRQEVLGFMMSKLEATMDKYEFNDLCRKVGFELEFSYAEYMNNGDDYINHAQSTCTCDYVCDYECDCDCHCYDDDEEEDEE